MVHLKKNRTSNSVNTCRSLSFVYHIHSTDCSNSYYGPNCLELCSNNCGVPRRCDRITGKCYGGCQAGWKEPKCLERKHFVVSAIAWN